MKTPEHLDSELRKYAVESNATLSDNEKDRAIIATVANYVFEKYGYTIGCEAWAEYVGRRSKNLGRAV